MDYHASLEITIFKGMICKGILCEMKAPQTSEKNYILEYSS